MDLFAVNAFTFSKNVNINPPTSVCVQSETGKSPRNLDCFFVLNLVCPTGLRQSPSVPQPQHPETDRAGTVNALLRPEAKKTFKNLLYLLGLQPYFCNVNILKKEKKNKRLALVVFLWNIKWKSKQTNNNVISVIELARKDEYWFNTP